MQRGITSNRKKLDTSVSVVVPVYNSAATLPRLVHELKASLVEIVHDFEIILVNDGSKDLSSQILKELCAENESLVAVDLSRNYGQHNALLCGIRRATKQIVVTLDDDLQNPPSEISKLLLKLDEGYDVVYGMPERESHGLLRDLASLTTKMVLQQAMGADIAQSISTFRAFKTDLRTAFDEYRSPYVCIDILLTWGTDNFGAVKVKHAQRAAGSSNYNFAKLVTHATNLITGFSVAPLQFASMVGFFLLGLSMIGICHVLYNYALTPGKFPGFAFLACAILTFSAAQLVSLGIIGEYLARMYARTMGKPVYMARSVRQSSGEKLSSSSVPLPTNYLAPASPAPERT